MVRDGIFKLSRSPGIDFKESISPAYVACRVRICKPFKKPRNRFPAWRNRSLGIDSRLHKRLQIRALAGRYDNPIPTRFLALIDCSKFPAQNGSRCEFVPPTTGRTYPSSLHIRYSELTRLGRIIFSYPLQYCNCIPVIRAYLSFIVSTVLYKRRHERVTPAGPVQG
jgi:hypothetical protein